MKYRLEHDFLLMLSPKEEQEAHERMAQYGTWDGAWWTPSRVAQYDVVAKIKREGYIIKERQL